jgi:hypothetical protein
MLQALWMYGSVVLCLVNVSVCLEKALKAVSIWNVYIVASSSCGQTFSFQSALPRTSGGNCTCLLRGRVA